MPVSPRYTAFQDSSCRRLCVFQGLSAIYSIGNGEKPPIRMSDSDYLNPEEEKLIREIFEDARNQVIDLLIKSRKM